MMLYGKKKNYLVDDSSKIQYQIKSLKESKKLFFFK